MVRLTQVAGGAMLFVAANAHNYPVQNDGDYPVQAPPCQVQPPPAAGTTNALSSTDAQGKTSSKPSIPPAAATTPSAPGYGVHTPPAADGKSTSKATTPPAATSSTAAQSKSSTASASKSTEAATTAPGEGYPIATPAIAGVVYSTRYHTISSCAPTVTDCPYGSLTSTIIAIKPTTSVIVPSEKPTGPYPAVPGRPNTTTTVAGEKPTGPAQPEQPGSVVTDCPYGSTTSSVVKVTPPAPAQSQPTTVIVPVPGEKPTGSYPAVPGKPTGEQPAQPQQPTGQYPAQPQQTTEASSPPAPTYPVKSPGESTLAKAIYPTGGFSSTPSNGAASHSQDQPPVPSGTSPGYPVVTAGASVLSVSAAGFVAVAFAAMFL
ncbi:membrane ycf1 [Apiospora saccharicola]|uniref:Membrane ycf1 n=1 Tax=Apiospora saccharicola TaxID=335842 RepID=A0ABR1VZY6_9PEZI